MSGRLASSEMAQSATQSLATLLSDYQSDDPYCFLVIANALKP